MIVKRNANKLSKLNRLLLWINYIFIISLLFSVASKYISPDSFWILAFFGLAFPIFLLVNIGFIIYWFSQFRVHGLFSMIAILISAKTCLGFVQIDFSNKNISNKDIKVMSYNSMLFDLYNWSKNAQSRNLILTSLAEENPDILCLQEFYTSEQKGDFNNIDTVTNLLTAKNSHIEYTTTLRKEDHWGIATFTKYPIIKKGKIEFNTRSNNICIYTDVLIKKDTVRIYNMHLQSISFSKADYKFIAEVNNDSTDTKDEVEKSKSILRRLKRAFLKRGKQADVINIHITNCRYKIILCGDFNDTPASYVYHTIRGNLKDAFIESGSGFEQTYAGKFPRFRIDYILHSKNFKSKKYHHLAETLTDHYPIVTYLE
jgi:endonuclease/exonuclease/phosphatase family metal-dependent hydrolase